MLLCPDRDSGDLSGPTGLGQGVGQRTLPGAGRLPCSAITDDLVPVRPRRHDAALVNIDDQHLGALSGAVDAGY